MKKSEGFTIIELLVVVAIIIIIVALIVFNLSSKRKVTAINSLQRSAEQIVASAGLYLDDHPTAASVTVTELVPDYMTSLPDNQVVVGSAISLTGGTSSFTLMDNGGAADGCVVQVNDGDVPTTDIIRENCQ